MASARKILTNLLKRRSISGSKDCLDYLVGEVARQNRSFEERGISAPDDFAELTNFKSSENLFVLGSGPSISKIRDSTWAEIRKNDSIGFNDWIFHDHVPTFYAFQGIDTPEIRDHFKLKISSNRSWRNVPVILRGSKLANDASSYFCELNYLFPQNPTFPILELGLHSKCPLEAEELLEFARALGLLRPNHFRGPVPKFRGTLLMLAALGVRMGYRNIILCGIDMEIGGHFWDEDVERIVSGVRTKEFLLGAPGISDMVSRTYSRNTVERYAGVLASSIFQDSGARLWVHDTSTSLAGTLPVWKSG